MLYRLCPKWGGAELSRTRLIFGGIPRVISEKVSHAGRRPIVEKGIMGGCGDFWRPIFIDA